MDSLLVDSLMVSFNTGVQAVNYLLSACVCGCSFCFGCYHDFSLFAAR